MKRCTIVGIVVLLMLAVVACDQESSLQDAIARAIAKTSEASSYRSAANFTRYGDIITYGGSLELEYVAPDRYHWLGIVIVDGGNITFATPSEGGYLEVETSSVWIETRYVGAEGYIRSSHESQWQVCEVRAPDWQPPPRSSMPLPMPPIPQTPPVPLATPTSTPTTTPTPTEDTCSLAHPPSLEESFEDLNLLSDLEKLPDEEIDGVNCSHYRGSRGDRDSYMDITDIWIDGDDYIRQERSETRFSEHDSSTPDEEWVTWFITTRYFDFNEPICIEPPEME